MFAVCLVCLLLCVICFVGCLVVGWLWLYWLCLCVFSTLLRLVALIVCVVGGLHRWLGGFDTWCLLRVS